MSLKPGLLTVSLRICEVPNPNHLSGSSLAHRPVPVKRVGDSGIIELGNTKMMQNRCEVYEEDVGKVSVGQRPRFECHD